ncbi:MAG: type II toxin-antitoxin system VapB15 family antitoxin [Cecembia sp.]
MKAALQVDLTFEQILSLVKQLSKKDKIKLSKELEKEAIKSRLGNLLETFQTEELDLDTITKEVESVRQEIYDKEKLKGNF